MRANWSFSWEEKRNKVRRPDITDIVLCWQDEQGQGVLVIEAKRAGGKLSHKDLDGGSAYLELPTIKAFERKWMAFLVSDSEKRGAEAALPPGTRIATRQDVGKCQVSQLANLHVGSSTRALIESYLVRHYSDLGMPFGNSLGSDDESFDGSQASYQLIRKLNAPDALQRFLLGSQAVFCARLGKMPEPPLDWLAGEPSFIDICARRSQTTRDREEAFWKL